MHLMAFEILAAMMLAGFILQPIQNWGPKFRVPTFFPATKNSAVFRVICSLLLAIAFAYAVASGIEQSEVICMVPACKFVAVADSPGKFWFSACMLFTSGSAAMFFSFYWTKWLRNHSRSD